MALHLLTESDVAELRRLRAKIDSIAGVGVTNAPDSVSIVPPPVVQTVVTDRPRGSVWGEVISSTGAEVEWQLLDGDWMPHPSGFTASAQSVGGVYAAVGERLRLFPSRSGWAFKKTEASVPVSLVVDSGDGGSATTPCTFVYRAAHATQAGNIPGTHTPLMQRPPAGQQRRAEWGTMFVDAQGEWRLMWCDEQWFNVSECAE